MIENLVGCTSTGAAGTRGTDGRFGGKSAALAVTVKVVVAAGAAEDWANVRGIMLFLELACDLLILAASSSSEFRPAS